MSSEPGLPAPECNHRAQDVVSALLASALVGVLAAWLMKALGASAVGAAGAGAASFAACFGIGMSALTYIRR